MKYFTILVEPDHAALTSTQYPLGILEFF